MAGRVEVHATGRVVHVGTGGHVLGVGVGNVALDLSEAADGFAVRGPLTGVAEHVFEAAAGDPGCHGAQRDALDLQVAHHVQQAVALLAQPVLDGHLTLLEHQFGRRRGAHPRLAVQTLAQRKAGEILFDHERTESLICLGIH